MCIELWETLKPKFVCTFLRIQNFHQSTFSRNAMEGFGIGKTLWEGKHRWQDHEIENIKLVIQDLQKMGLCADLVKLCCNVVLLFWKLSLYGVAGLCCNLFCCSLASHVKWLLICPVCFNKIHVDVMNVICFNLKNYDIDFLLLWWINHEFIYFIFFGRPICFVACAKTLLWFWTKTWAFL